MAAFRSVRMPARMAHIVDTATGCATVHNGML